LCAMVADSVGYGYRPAEARVAPPFGEASLTGFKKMMAQFWDQREYYHIELSTLTTAVAGEVGLAWGVYIEEFQEKGRSPERARVRYTCTLMKGEDSWKILLYHRDIQPFDDQGWYPRALTAVLAAT